MLRLYSDATREFETTVRLDPGHAEGHNNLGAMLHIAGQLDRAAAEYHKAIDLRPDNAEAH